MSPKKSWNLPRAFTRYATGLLLAFLAVPVLPAEPPQLGEPINSAALAQLPITVLPDGTGAPAGTGTASQGELIYQRHCLACHGADGNGGINNALAGGQGTLNTAAPNRTVGSFWPYATTLLDYINRSMPYNTPGSLNNDELYAVTAYVLQLNDIISANHELNAQTLADVRMPNRDGFNWPARFSIDSSKP